MSNIKNMTESLETLFAELDAQQVVATVEYLKGRLAALRAFEASDEYKAIRNDAFKVYPKLFDLCGGKTMFAVVKSGGYQAFAEKNVAAKAKARNAKIVKRLMKDGATAVKDVTKTQTRDGFNGYFLFDTPEGEKSVLIQTIIAGGYNIQCRHYRVLVK